MLRYPAGTSVIYAALIAVLILAGSARPVGAQALSGFDEWRWRRLAAQDPLQAVDWMRERLRQPMDGADRIRALAMLGGLLADELGDLEGGADQYRLALAVDPSAVENAEVRRRLAYLLVSQGDYPAARKEFEFLLAQNPADPGAFSLRATLDDIRDKPKRAPGTPAPPRVRKSSPLPATAPVKAAAVPPDILVRVLVARGDTAEITSSGTMFFYTGAGASLGSQLKTSGCKAQANGVACGAAAANIIQVIPAQGRTLSVNGRAYHGAMVVRLEGRQLIVVNRLGVEEYLYGVLPKEVPDKWPSEALKAQAVAARTYAYSQIGRALGLPYDVEDTVMSQVYGGIDAEQPSTNAAVDQTKGLVLRYGGNIIIAYFHSHSGGRTEDPAHVWGAKLPYLVSRDDPHSLASGAMAWRASFSRREVKAKLAAEFPEIGAIRSLRVTRRNGVRAEKIKVVGELGSGEMSANRLRLALGPAKLKSTAFSMKETRDGYAFTGTGYGHGVGLSQFGAMAMAQRGAGFRTILNFYYRGVSIERNAQVE